MKCNRINDKLFIIQIIIFITLLLSMSSAFANAKSKITIFAAASLTNVLDEIIADYQKMTGIEIVASYASSSTLSRQIVQGAPADLFISADQYWMDYLEQRQQIESDKRQNLLTNRLVLIAPSHSALTLIDIDEHTDWQALLQQGRLALGDPTHVPAGRYAKQAFEKLGVWPQIEPWLAHADNVRNALLLVERAEVPLGVVYASDAKSSQKVKIIAIFDENGHDPIVYPVTLIKAKSDKQNKKQIMQFYHYLFSQSAKEHFTKYGFSTVQ